MCDLNQLQQQNMLNDATSLPSGGAGGQQANNMPCSSNVENNGGGGGKGSSNLTRENIRSPSGTTYEMNSSSKSQRTAKQTNFTQQQQHQQEEQQQTAEGGPVGDNTVVHKDRNGTITVQSTKTVGKSNYSFVSVSPTKKMLVDQQQIKHIKVIQQNESKSWVGLNIQFTQRPGMGNIHTNRKFVKMSEYFKLEDDRFKQMLELVNRVRDCEEEKMAFSGMSQPMQEKQLAAQGAILSGNSQPQRVQEFINFKMPKDLALINRDGMLVLCYTKPSQYEQTQFEMFFKMVKADAKLVKAVMETNGLGQTEGNEWNVLWTSQSVKHFMYDSMNEFQKINHFPNSNELTRKDRLCENVVKMQERFGKEVFNIIPDSYILPDEFADFYSHFHMLRSKEQPNMWIIKPQNSSQGKGIYIIDDISEVPIDENCIISRYVSNPFLINGLKFDLRLYVCITSMDPWRVYIFNEGLVRFASEPYDVGLGKGAKYSHLTNFSINKKNDKYVNNQSAEADDCGHKWSLQALTKHLEQVGIDMSLLWSRIYDVILKSLLCVDNQIQSHLKKMTHKNNCFELLGYDVLIDQDLKPWLMEVNLSPSLATESPLDLKIKSQLFLDTINMACVRKFDRRRDNITKMKNRFKNIMRAKSYQSRQNYPNSAAPSKNGLGADGKDRRGRDPDDWIGEQKKATAIEKITALNSRFREVLRDTLIENNRKNNFIRIYPTRTSDIYDQYFTQPKQLHKSLFKALFTNEIVPFQTTYPMMPNSNITKPRSQTDVTEDAQSSAVQVPKVVPPGAMLAPEKPPHYSERSGAAPSSPSKVKQDGIESRGINLHPTIPEEPERHKVGQKGGAAGSEFGVSCDNSNFSESANQPYGSGRDQTGNKAMHDSERNNSTAKSQKRQELQRRKTFATKSGTSSTKQSIVGNPSTTGGQSSTTQYGNNLNESRHLVPNQSNGNNQGTAQSPFSLNSGAETGGGSGARRGTGSGVMSSTADLQPVSQGGSGSQQPGREKLLITGDDVLIEYVHRLMIAVQSIKEVMLKPQWKHQIEKFIKHYVWHTSDVRRAANNKLWQRLESRLIEMKERRKRLLQNIYLREKNMDTNLPKINQSDSLDNDYSLDFQREYETKEAQKNVIIQGFSASQLEEMLRTSTRNVAYEVISCLIDANGRGVLTEIIKFLTISNKHIIEVEENGSSILDNLNKNSHSHYGRHHNYFQNSKYGNKVPRIDENEEDPESYANINIGLTSNVSNPKRSYNNGGTTSGMSHMTGGGASNNTNVSGSGGGNGQQQTLASQQTAGSNNDIRIKIRKNSIEPHLIAKANHKQIVRQKILKEQQQRQYIQYSQAVNSASNPIDENQSKAQGSMSVTPLANVQRSTLQSLSQKEGGGTEDHHSKEGQVLDERQLSIEELQVRPQRSQDKAAKGGQNGLFENSTSRDLLTYKDQQDPKSIDLKVVAQTSKTARGIDSIHSQDQVQDASQFGLLKQSVIGGNQVLNQDLISSAENLNNEMSPKQDVITTLHSKTEGTVVSRTSNTSQYLQKFTQETKQSGSTLEGLKGESPSLITPYSVELQIQNQPRGRLGNFKKGNGQNGSGNDQLKAQPRKPLNGKILSTTSIQSLTTKKDAGTAPTSTLTNISSSTGHKSAKQPPFSPKKSKRESPNDLDNQPTPDSIAKSSNRQMAASFNVNQLGGGELQPQKQLTSQTEKKTEKRFSTTKQSKNQIKVIKRNLIQSSELVSRELGNGATAEQDGLLGSSGPKRSSNARGSSSKGGAGGAKGTGNRQHKF